MKLIPLGSLRQRDIMVWHYESKGCYTVHSRYQLALELKQTNQLSASTSSMDTSRLWKLIWKLAEPQQIINFIWHAALDTLPTRGLLHSRISFVHPSCALCDCVESSVHLHHDCFKVRSVWGFGGWAQNELHGPSLAHNGSAGRAGHMGVAGGQRRREQGSSRRNKGARALGACERGSNWQARVPSELRKPRRTRFKWTQDARAHIGRQARARFKQRLGAARRTQEATSARGMGASPPKQGSFYTGARQKRGSLVRIAIPAQF
ncbi:hypothetical protein GH714_030921 [Hevea brasiliensis]|uniref:Reverse transcriptase zinc-binding domain-containing protein n=1 Tax=Hevea brasiliensis TaxID=3981 RepID=A0A6A6LNE3_HEVBR|nr:hypothetical protein GH714_030921 [Hevea brasiliensis]